MNTLLTIWTKPRKTFEYLSEKKYTDIASMLNVLIFLGSIGLTVQVMDSKTNVWENYGLAVKILGFICITFLTFWGLKYGYVWLLRLTGKVLQGEASLPQLRIVLAYALIPSMVHLAVFLILLFLFISVKNIEPVGCQDPLTLILISIFSLRTSIIGLSKFNKYSYGYALLNMFLLFGLVKIVSMVLLFFMGVLI